MGHYIVTNNPLVKDDYKNIIFIDRIFLDVLIKTRDLVYSGHELINHPLGASIRMFYSPYRSIIVGDQPGEGNQYFMETIENSIENYKKHMEVREPDITNSQDYSVIDKELLISALKEHVRFSN